MTGDTWLVLPHITFLNEIGLRLGWKMYSSDEWVISHSVLLHRINKYTYAYKHYDVSQS